MAISQALPSSSKIKKTLETKKKILKKRATDGLTSKPKKAVPFNLDKSIVSYEPKVETTSDCKIIVRNKCFPMGRALEVQSNLESKFPSFVKNMLPSHVAGGFWLSFPKYFTDLHLPKQDDTVVLVDESGKEYETKYLVDKNGLSGGWRGFSIAHKLMEKDVLVFQLIQPCKFKVYIVRANALTEIDGAIGLLNLDACATKMDIVKKEDDLKITEMACEEHLESRSLDHNNQDKAMVVLGDNDDDAPDQADKDMVVLSDDDTVPDQTGENTDDYGAEDSEGIRFSESVVDFKDVKDFKNFNILVDGLIIDCEIPQHLRVKYYEICCSQKSYIHNKLIDGLNIKLVAGVILETINIADAIRCSKLTTSRQDLKSWDRTLQVFEGLGMEVGFLRARINKLMALLSESEESLKCKRLEKVKAEEEFKALEMKLISVKDEITNLDSEIDALNIKGEKLEALFMTEAKAPW